MSFLARFGHAAVVAACPFTGVQRTSRLRAPKSEFVKVFGCRPHDGGAAHTGAGVRKPPMEETAMGERMVVPRS